MIGSQQARSGGAAPAAGSRRAVRQPTGETTQRQAPPLDEAKVQSLTTILKSDPNNASATLQLANTYFDAERWNDAISWYERTLKLEPRRTWTSTPISASATTT